MLFVKSGARFPVLLNCLTKPDFAELDYHFKGGLMNTLLKAGANEVMLAAAANARRFFYNIQAVYFIWISNTHRVTILNIANPEFELLHLSIP